MGYISGLYSGLTYTISPCNNAQDVANIDAMLAQYITDRREDSVVSIVQMPTAFVSTTAMPAVEAEAYDIPNKIGSYEPRNNKLLTYPFSYMVADSLDSSATFRYEYSNAPNGKMNFSYVCSVSGNPEISMQPLYYNGSGTGINYTERMCISGFPECPWASDTYRAWLAQKSVGFVANNLGKTVLGVAGMLASTNPVGAVAIGGATFMSVLGSSITETLNATEGDKPRGNVGSSTAVGGRFKKVYFKYMSVNDENARIIDDFFDRYGYTCNRIKVPNRNVRPHWCYTKTTDVAIRGDIPVDDMAKIKEIYNKGVTFWKNGNELGDYSLDNRIILG